MTDGTGTPDSADALHTTEVTALLADVARLVGELEALIAGRDRSTPPRASTIADQQAEIVAAAHEEAAAVLAAAHAAAARILDRASRGEPSSVEAPLPSEAVLDLRDSALDADRRVAPAIGQVPPPHPPADDAPESTAPVVGGGDDDLRASLASAIDMARGLSERIEQLTRELHESSAS